MPTLTGVPLSTAVQELKSAGFTSTPSVNYANGPVDQNIPVGTVWKQFPASGTVPPNTVITLFVQQTAATPTTSATPSGTPSGDPERHAELDGHPDRDRDHRPARGLSAGSRP